MKVRVISAAVGLILFLTVVIIGSFFPAVLCAGFCLVSALAVFEMLFGTRYIDQLQLLLPALIFSVLAPVVMAGYIPMPYLVLAVLYGAVVLIVTLIWHRSVTLEQSLFTLCMPLMIATSVALLISVSQLPSGGFFCFLLVFNFAWVADGGAYFIGSFFGKHKLAPRISPKKTVEGALGGIGCCVVVSLIMGLIYQAATGQSLRLLLLVLITPVMTACGIVGDLAASFIKRQCGIKDFGNVLPGHGGVLDRFDSVLFVAPMFYILLWFAPIT